ncbi:flagellar basal body protein FliL [Pandoraea thiooxydans]|nr:flagellar basal body protein FliL [Pandoraea thiooxydans]
MSFLFGRSQDRFVTDNTSQIQVITMANPATPQPAAAKRRPWLLIGIVLLLMSVTGTAAAVYLMHRNKSDAHRVKPPAPPVFVSMEPFTVNLADTDSDRYLHIGLALKVSDTTNQQRIVEHMPEVRSRILLLLASKQVSDLGTIADKHKLASEIRTLVDQPFGAGLPAQQVTNVLFTDFVIQ